MRSEFQFIQHIKERFSLHRVGDDCAILPKNDDFDMLVTADLLVEDIDFRLAWADAMSLGHKALAVSLSDIAAMGGRGLWSTSSIGIPEHLWKTDFLDDFYAGWHSLAAIYGVELVGGDVSRSPDKLVIDSVVIGEVEKGRAIKRSGAKPGDLIYVSGKLGAAAAGLKLLEASPAISDANPMELNLIDHQLRPIPRLHLAKELLELNILTSMIDLSDGLSSDLRHICEASNVGAVVEKHLIPRSEGLEEAFDSIPEKDNAVLSGGEDFELLFTISPENVVYLDGLSVTRIGIVTADAGQVVLLDGEASVPLQPEGFQHF